MDVHKTYKVKGPCEKTAAEVLSDIEETFGAFASTDSAVPFTPSGVDVGTLFSWATFSGGPITVGSTVTATDVVAPLLVTGWGPAQTKTASLLVTSVNANGFSLAPQPGAPLTGSINISVVQQAGGDITVSVVVLGNLQGGFFTQMFNGLALSAGGQHPSQRWEGLHGAYPWPGASSSSPARARVGTP